MLWDLVVHLDTHLAEFVAQYGVWVYALLFVIVFCETGLVVTPFLPGDSLLFVAGAIAAVGGMNIFAVAATLVAAALCGDNVNYWAGRWLGAKVFARVINPAHLQRTQAFYDRHGGKTIILARFMPVVRTFAPFVAGIGQMRYAQFAAFNVVGGVLWVAAFTLAGYYFGELPVVKQNFHYVILAIIVISTLPPVVRLMTASVAS